MYLTVRTRTPITKTCKSHESDFGKRSNDYERLAGVISVSRNLGNANEMVIWYPSIHPFRHWNPAPSLMVWRLEVEASTCAHNYEIPMYFAIHGQAQIQLQTDPICILSATVFFCLAFPTTTLWSSSHFLEELTPNNDASNEPHVYTALILFPQQHTDHR